MSNSKKWFTLVLSVSLALCVLSGCDSYESEHAAPSSSQQPQERIETTKLVKTDATTTATANGLMLQSATEYEAKINGTFDMGTNIAIDFGWVFETASTEGKLVFRLTDVTDETNFVDVVYHNHTYNNAWTQETLNAATVAGYDVSQYIVGDSRYRSCSTYVQWGEEIRSSNVGGTQIYNEIKRLCQN